MTALESWTLGIALAGMALSLFTLGWTVNRDLLDRANVKVRASRVVLLGPAGDAFPGGGNNLISITATNHGRRKAIIQEFHIPIEGTTQRLGLITPDIDTCSARLPAEINEGDPVTIYWPTSQLGMPLNETPCFCAVDSLGRVWKSPPFPLR